MLFFVGMDVFLFYLVRQFVGRRDVNRGGGPPGSVVGGALGFGLPCHPVPDTGQALYPERSRRARTPPYPWHPSHRLKTCATAENRLEACRTRRDHGRDARATDRLEACPTRRDHGRDARATDRLEACPTGFTMIEAIVSLLIVGILAGLISVRMSNTLDRRADHVAARVEAVLETLAHRMSIGQHAAALVMVMDDDEGASLYLEMLISDPEEDGVLLWERDLMAPVVVFDDQVSLDSVTFNSESVSGDLRIVISPNEDRPAIVIGIVYGETVDYVELLPHDLRAHRWSDDDYGEYDRVMPVDLDALGESEVPWG